MKRRTRRWSRILFNTLTAISLLLAIATAGLWVRSGWSMDEFSLVNQRLLRSGDRSVRIALARTISGTVTLKIFDDIYCAGTQDFQSWARSPEGVRFGHRSMSRGGTLWTNLPVPRWYFRSEAWNDPPDQWQGMHRGFDISFPIWFLLLAVSIVPAVRLVRSRRIRIAAGLCPACGYDMRANPTKCSECGQEMPATTEVESA